MAGVFDRPMFRSGMGGTMEDTGFQYPQPFGYGAGQVDPSIAEAVKQRSMRGSQIVQGGEYASKDVPDLRSQFQSFRNELIQKIQEARASSDPRKYETIRSLEDQLAKMTQDQKQLVDQASGITYTAKDKYGMLADVGAMPNPNLRDPMPPQLMDIFQNISERAAQGNVAIPAVTKKPPTPGTQTGPSGMEMEARRLQPASPAAPAAPAVGGRTTMEADARDRGPLALSPANVATALNDPKPEVREKTAADFAKQFADMSPKYEGVDKGLLMAQIGFAIAAGESPSAMKNIADGFLSGADTMIKDRAAKAEFDRQVKLSAMQYGLAEEGKLRDRASNPLMFVALEDTTYKGKKVAAGDQVYIPYGDIEKNGGLVPAGFGDTSMVTAITNRQKNTMALIQDTYEQGLIDDTYLSSETEKYSKAVSTAASSQRALDYLESAMLKVGEGGVTGLAASASSLAAKLASAAGLPDIAKKYTTRDEFVSDMEIAFQNMMPASLAGVQSANSISNMDVNMMANAFADAALKDGVFSLTSVSDDVLLNKLKSASELMQAARQQSLATMAGVEQNFSGRYLRSGSLTSPVSATTALDPYKNLLSGSKQSASPTSFGRLTMAEDGTYEILYPGN